MKYNELVYQPQEDTHLLLDSIIKNIKNQKLNILEIGCGSGYVSINLLKEYNNLKITCTDINKNAIKLSKENAKENNIKIKFIESNLFENIKQEYDIIIFNPPYLPQDKLSSKHSIDTALYGGKKGYEITHQFIEQVYNNLKPNGKIFLLLCSLSKPKTSLELLNKFNYEYKLIKQIKIFPEELFVYEIEFNEFLKEMKNKKIKTIEFISKGKKGNIYSGNLKNKKIKIKQLIENKNNQSFVTIQNEVNLLNKLKKQSFVQKIIENTDNYFISSFIEGITFESWLEKNKSKNNFKKIILKILEICQILDIQKIDKKEMVNPYKHILIDKKENVYFIDFERSSICKNPKNITQVINYFCSKKINDYFKKFNINLNIKILNQLCKKYKKDYDEKKFKDIINNLF
ncbi:methyltransferase [Candidatus Woesearchaeota archaeon]|jgi:release factor glutamine methyltransferase|nr:methyltransferase [Candidatus Woesearchaeota archaeon]MBT4387127.1 methyltransferase [Candidatus Woesearchaeota archaeon]MBT4596116.1 methyltransferase [Candidatus Woesearchaeota archaeon]MBT5741662.1 methyltransferase [Candidatus Woesearchaeota archaeon]MBT7962858.1 methyltransferase [Candidatus Woesearchaeota archaeon]